MTDEQAALIAKQIERMNDPNTARDAQARADAATRESQPQQWRMTLQHRQLQAAPTFGKRLFWLRHLATTWAEGVRPHSACQYGCSGCCHQPVMLSQQEARAIAKDTGRQVREPARWRSEPAAEFTGEPCPFLTQGRCSIYAHRPMSCRLLFNFDADDLLCRIVPGSPAQVPYANATQMHMLYVMAHVPSGTPEGAASVRMADVRDFFEKELML